MLEGIVVKVNIIVVVIRINKIIVFPGKNKA
jgi:hypothetical protein